VGEYWDLDLCDGILVTAYHVFVIKRWGLRRQRVVFGILVGILYEYLGHG
jgi:hypothetical protein